MEPLYIHSHYSDFYSLRILFASLFTHVLLLSLGTLSIDNETHDDDLRNPRRIGSRVRSCCFEETTSFGSPTSCSRYGFQKRPKSASN